MASFQCLDIFVKSHANLAHNFGLFLMTCFQGPEASTENFLEQHNFGIVCRLVLDALVCGADGSVQSKELLKLDFYIPVITSTLQAAGYSLKNKYSYKSRDATKKEEQRIFAVVALTVISAGFTILLLVYELGIKPNEMSTVLILLASLMGAVIGFIFAHKHKSGAK
jgi:hypothetical protein